MLLQMAQRHLANGRFINDSWPNGSRPIIAIKWRWANHNKNTENIAKLGNWHWSTDSFNMHVLVGEPDSA